MKHSKLFPLALCLMLMALSTSITRAQTSTSTPEHYLRERSVTRVQGVRFGLPAFSHAAADQLIATRKQNPRAGQRMRLDFFPDVSLPVNLDHVEQQGRNVLAWSGNVEGAPYSSATFVMIGNRLTGSVTRGDGKIYQLRTTDDGTQWGLEIDQSRFPNDEADSAPTPSLPANTDSAFVQNDAVAASDDGSTIDVMVLYTPAARLSAGSQTQMESLVQLGIAETNQGYLNSGVTQRVRLVRAQEINYTEASSISTDLSRLSNQTDGFLDEVGALRNTYGADLVNLWVETSESTCGIGYVLANTTSTPTALAAYGYSVNESHCATGNYTFGHEMGHNMGANHAKSDLNSNGSAPVGVYSYSNGYKQTSGTDRFRTIMAYDCSPSCPRILYWSNPGVTYHGMPVGIDPNSSQGASNALTLNNTSAIVANFRQTVVNPTPGGPDTNAPALIISSHTNGQAVQTSSITISGIATDSGLGDSGISSVTVNGVAATGGTATGPGTASWSRTLTLNSGSNTITVVARDNSAAQNAATTSITINLSATGSATSATANTYHVFPQFADGRFSDGTYYRTTLLISNPTANASSNCTLQLHGLTVPGFVLSYTLAPSGWVISSTSGTQTLKSGYATLQCTTSVEAQLLYSYYSPSGVKISEATVFSSPPAGSLQVLGDNRENARIAIAIANDSDQQKTYLISAYDTGGNPVGSVSRTIAARGNYAAFVSDIISLPANYYGPVYVDSSSGTASVIGLRYTGGAFTTIPAINESSVAATARTYHVFPQFADGRTLSDGSYYRTTVMISNPGDTSGDCTFRLYGLDVNGFNSFTYQGWSPGAWYIETAINSTQALRSGYATLTCGFPAEAQLLYSYYAADGTKISEATVFSSPSAANLQVLADNRESAQLGVAVANDSDQDTSFTMTAYTADGTPITSPIRVLRKRTNIAGFLNDFFTTAHLPADYNGPVFVSAGAGTSIIGLRYTGTAFTTIPQTNR